MAVANSDGYLWADPGTWFLDENNILHIVESRDSEPIPFTPERDDTPVHISTCGLSDAWHSTSFGYARGDFSFVTPEQVRDKPNVTRCPICFCD